MGYLGLIAAFFWATAAPAWEITLPLADKIQDQGDYGYCGLYAMSSFLELYAKGKNPSSVPTLDPAFLATAHNLEIGNGVGGTNTDDLMYLTQRYGAVPLGAKPAAQTDAFAWPPKDWAHSHTKLMDDTAAESVLSAKFTHEKFPDTLTGREFLDQKIGINFSDWGGYFNEYKEKCEKDGNRKQRLYRGENYDEVKKALETKRTELGLNLDTHYEDADLLYTLLVAQLYTKTPALISLRTGLIKNFGRRVLLTSGDLKEVEKGGCSTHIGVAVGHCHKRNASSGLCRHFEKYLSELENPTDCIVFQNSWGTHSNEKGYVCITKAALRRALKAVFLLKAFH